MNNFPEDTVKYRIQIICNTFFGRQVSPDLAQVIQDTLNQDVPPYCAEDFKVQIKMRVGVYIRVDCSVRGEEHSYDIYPEQQDEMPHLPPLSREELAESARRYELAHPRVPTKRILIVAMSDNFVIGKEGKLPWHIPNDLKFFKDQTTGHPLVVGRKTYQSMPDFVWKTRTPHILTRDPHNFEGPNCPYHASDSLGSLVHCAGENFRTGKVFIAGGAEVYRQALDQDLVDEMLVTHVKGVWAGDTFFEFVPGFGPGEVVLEDPEFTVSRYTRYVKLEA